MTDVSNIAYILFSWNDLEQNIFGSQMHNLIQIYFCFLGFTNISIINKIAKIFVYSPPL